MGSADAKEYYNGIKDWKPEAYPIYYELLEKQISETQKRESNLYSRIGLLMSCELVALGFIANSISEFMVDYYAIASSIIGILLLLAAIVLQAYILIPFPRMVIPANSVRTDLFQNAGIGQYEMLELCIVLRSDVYDSLSKKITDYSTKFGYSIIVMILGLSVLCATISYKLLCGNDIVFYIVFVLDLFITYILVGINNKKKW